MIKRMNLATFIIFCIIYTKLKEHGKVFLIILPNQYSKHQGTDEFQFCDSDVSEEQTQIAIQWLQATSDQTHLIQDVHVQEGPNKDAEFSGIHRMLTVQVGREISINYSVGEEHKYELETRK